MRWLIGGVMSFSFYSTISLQGSIWIRCFIYLRLIMFHSAADHVASIQSVGEAQLNCLLSIDWFIQFSGQSCRAEMRLGPQILIGFVFLPLGGKNISDISDTFLSLFCSFQQGTGRCQGMLVCWYEGLERHCSPLPRTQVLAGPESHHMEEDSVADWNQKGNEN